jgi:Domain of unknown function (DUF5664)
MPRIKKDIALKYDSGKADLSQISLELVELLARVRMFGEQKYARDNWKNGFKVTRSLSACLRHIFRFLGGETFDPESGLSHLGHAVACLEHAIWDMKHNPSNDDRYKPPTNPHEGTSFDHWVKGE